MNRIIRSCLQLVFSTSTFSCIGRCLHSWNPSFVLCPGLLLAADKSHKDQDQGSYDSQSATQNNAEVYVTKMFDNRGVVLISSFVAIEAVTTIDRFDNQTKSKISVELPVLQPSKMSALTTLMNLINTSLLVEQSYSARFAFT